MDEIVAQLTSPGWWFSNVLVALVISIVASLLFAGFSKKKDKAPQRENVPRAEVPKIFVILAGIHALLAAISGIYLVLPERSLAAKAIFGFLAVIFVPVTTFAVLRGSALATTIALTLFLTLLCYEEAPIWRVRGFLFPNPLLYLIFTAVSTAIVIAGQYAVAIVKFFAR